MKDRLEVRIPKSTKEKLKNLAEEFDLTITEMIEKVIEEYHPEQKPIGMIHTNSKKENKNDKKLNALLVINLLNLKQQYPSLDINKMIFNMDRIIDEEIFEKVSEIEYQ